MQFFFVLQKKKKKNGATQNLSLFLLPPVVPNDLIWLRFLPSRSLNHLKDGGRYKKNFLQIFFCIYFFFQSKTPHFNCYTLGDKFHMQLLKLRIKMELLRTKKLENLNLMMREASLCFLKT